MESESYPKLSKCFFSYIETRRICFLFRLGDDAGKIQKEISHLILYQKVNSLCSRPLYNLVTRVYLLENEMKIDLENEIGHPNVVTRATDISIELRNYMAFSAQFQAGSF